MKRLIMSFVSSVLLFTTMNVRAVGDWDTGFKYPVIQMSIKTMGGTVSYYMNGSNPDDPNTAATTYPGQDYCVNTNTGITNTGQNFYEVVCGWTAVHSTSPATGAYAQDDSAYNYVGSSNWLVLVYIYDFSQQHDYYEINYGSNTAAAYQCIPVDDRATDLYNVSGLTTAWQCTQADIIYSDGFGEDSKNGANSNYSYR